MTKDRHTAKKLQGGQSNTQVCYLICINSFPLSAIKNSHKKPVYIPVTYFNSQFKLGLYIKGFLLLGREITISFFMELYMPNSL